MTSKQEEHLSHHGRSGMELEVKCDPGIPSLMDTPPRVIPLPHQESFAGNSIEESWFTIRGISPMGRNGEQPFSVCLGDDQLILIVIKWNNKKITIKGRDRQKASYKNIFQESQEFQITVSYETGFFKINFDCNVHLCVIYPLPNRMNPECRLYLQRTCDILEIKKKEAGKEVRSSNQTGRGEDQISQCDETYKSKVWPELGDIIQFINKKISKKAYYGIYAGVGGKDTVFHFDGESVQLDNLETVADERVWFVQKYYDRRVKPANPKAILAIAMRVRKSTYAAKMFKTSFDFAIYCRFLKSPDPEVNECTNVMTIYSTIMRPGRQVYLQPGDIVLYPRRAYNHYALYIGDGRIIHMARNPDAGSRDTIISISCFGSLVSPIAIAVEVDWDVPVNKTYTADNVPMEKEDDWQGTVRIFDYLDTMYPPLLPEEIVARAKDALGTTQYSLFRQNCQHFANACRYGKKMTSLEVTKWASLHVNNMQKCFPEARRNPSEGYIQRRPVVDEGRP